MSQQLANYFDSDFKNGSKQKITGGYVEFSILEETHVHYFTRSDDLRLLEQYVNMDKPSLGLKQFIRDNYTPENVGRNTISDDDITIWIYDFELE